MVHPDTEDNGSPVGTGIDSRLVEIQSPSTVHNVSSVCIYLFRRTDSVASIEHHSIEHWIGRFQHTDWCPSWWNPLQWRRRPDFASLANVDIPCDADKYPQSVKQRWWSICSIGHNRNRDVSKPWDLTNASRRTLERIRQSTSWTHPAGLRDVEVRRIRYSEAHHVVYTFYRPITVAQYAQVYLKYVEYGCSTSLLRDFTSSLIVSSLIG